MAHRNARGADRTRRRKQSDKAIKKKAIFRLIYHCFWAGVLWVGLDLSILLIFCEVNE
jgi:hypothetical protein